MGVLKDLKIVTRESKYLPFLFATNSGDSGKYDETGIAKQIPSLARLLGQAVIGCPRKIPPKRIDYNVVNTTTEDKWFFVNGICTNEEILRMNIQYLSELFGVNIVAIHNPTNGILYDLTECVTGRTLDIGEPVSKFISDEVEKVVLRNKVRIIAHSQGGIIVDNMIRYLKFKNVFLNNLEIYTFASASDGETYSQELYQEHFSNEEDFVARIGLAAPEYKPTTLYVRKGGKGHLLNRNYLTAFKNGKICGGKSRLYSLLKAV